MKTGGSPKEQARRRTEVLYKELKSAIEDICQLPDEPHLRLKAHTLLAVHCIVVSSHGTSILLQMILHKFITIRNKK